MSGDTQRVDLTLYTDSHLVRGTIETRQRRLLDILNQTEHEFLVIQDAVMDEFGSRDQPIRAEHAQINLGAVLFAVSDIPVEPLPELRTPKIAEMAIISIPPFRVTGHIHLLPGRPLDDALDELLGRFLPVTNGTYSVIADRRGTDNRDRRRGQSRSRPDPGALSRGRSVGGPRSFRGRRGRSRRGRALGRRAAPGVQQSSAIDGEAQRSTGRSSRSPHSDHPPS